MAECLPGRSLEALVPSPELKEAGEAWEERQTLFLVKLLVKSSFFFAQTVSVARGTGV